MVQSVAHERRSVPLVGYALDVLAQHAKVRRLDTSLVFSDPTGGKFLHFHEAFDNAHLSEAHTRGVVERMNRAMFGEL